MMAMTTSSSINVNARCEFIRSKEDTAVRIGFNLFNDEGAIRAKPHYFVWDSRPVSRVSDEGGDTLKRAWPRAIVLEKKFEPRHIEAPIFQPDGAARNLSTMKSFVIPVLAVLETGRPLGQ
jgi:hypothetical protein